MAGQHQQWMKLKLIPFSQTQKLEESRSQAAARQEEEGLKAERLQQELDAGADLRGQCAALKAETERLQAALSSLQASASRHAHA